MPPLSSLTLAQKAILKAKLARSYAISSAHNPRNLESHWYSVWSHTLIQLVEDHADFIVCPQFTIYFSRDPPSCDDDDDDILAEEDLPDMTKKRGSLSTAKQHDTREVPQITDWEDDVLAGLAEFSFSTVGTEAVADADTVIADFAIIHTSSKKTNEFRGRYGGWRILGVAVPLLVENKRYTKRQLKGDERVKDIAPLIRTAREEVEQQAAYVFRQYGHMKSLIAIAACGPWWTYVVLTPADVRTWVEADPFEVSEDEQVVRWKRLLKLHTPSSDERLKEVQALLGEMSRDRFTMDD